MPVGGTTGTRRIGFWLQSTNGFAGANGTKRYMISLIVTSLMLPIWNCSALAQSSSNRNGMGSAMMNGDILAQVMSGFMNLLTLVGVLLPWSRWFLPSRRL